MNIERTSLRVPSPNEAAVLLDDIVDSDVALREFLNGRGETMGRRNRFHLLKGMFERLANGYVNSPTGKVYKKMHLSGFIMVATYARTLYETHGYEPDVIVTEATIEHARSLIPTAPR